MTDENNNKIYSLVNLGQGELLKQVYNDSSSPAVKKVGLALETIFDLSNTILLPVRLLNEKTKTWFIHNLKKYQQKLDKIDEDKIVEVRPELGIPILERLTYSTNEELTDLFTNLLLSASTSDRTHIAHPSFIHIIDRMCPDEAKIIEFLTKDHAVARMTIKMWEDDNSTYRFAIKDVTGIEKKIKLIFPDNINLYFDNLCSLGILTSQIFYYTKLEPQFAELKEIYKDKISEAVPINIPEDKKQERAEEEFGMFNLTDLGHLFLRACVTK